MEDLNLTTDFVNNYWKNTDIEFYKLIQQIEKIEHWTIDNEETNSLLNNLISKIPYLTKKTLTDLDDDFISLMSYIPFSKMCMLMHWFDEHHPGLSLHYVMTTRQLSGEQFLKFTNRLKFLSRTKFPHLIFSKMRVRLIKELLKNENDC